MRDSIKGNFEELKEFVIKQTQKNNYKIAIIAAITVVIIAAVIGALVYCAKGYDYDDFSEFEDDFEEDDFEEE